MGLIGNFKLKASENLDLELKKKIMQASSFGLGRKHELCMCLCKWIFFTTC